MSSCAGCDGIRRAFISPVADTVTSEAITSGAVASGKVIGEGSITCVSLCKESVARINQARIIEYSTTLDTLVKASLDIYLFNSANYTASVGGDLSISSQADWESLVGIIPINNIDYKRVIPTSLGYLTFAYADFNMMEGPIKPVKTGTLVDKTLFVVLMNASGQTVDYGTNNIYVELYVEK